MPTSSLRGRPTAWRYRNRFECAPPHERCRPGARSLRVRSSHRRRGGSQAQERAPRDRGRRSRGSHLGPGRAREWPRPGGVPLASSPDWRQAHGRPPTGDGAWVRPFSRQGGEVHRPLLPAPRTAPRGHGGPVLAACRGTRGMRRLRVLPLAQRGASDRTQRRRSVARGGPLGRSAPASHRCCSASTGPNGPIQ
jgi:hypothetical protein